MSKQTVRLVAIASVMLVLVALDYSGFFLESESDDLPESAVMNNAERYLSIIKARGAINAAYAELAAAYAEQVYSMDTFFETAIEPSEAVKQFVKRQAKLYGLKVENLNVGDPQFMGEGVFWFLVDVGFVSYSSKAAINAWQGFADVERGSTWMSFDFSALDDEKKLLLSGQLAVVYVQAVE